MFKYSWQCLYDACGRDCYNVIRILRYYDGKPVDIDVASIIATISKCPKTAYIHNLRGLLSDKTVTANDKCVYLYVASKRNISDFEFYGIDYLNRNLTLTNVSKLEHNRLFEFDNDNIYFKY